MKKKINDFVKQFIKVLKRPEMAILPGQLAYFLVVAIIPTITTLTIGASYLNLSTDAIYTYLSTAFSEDFAGLILSSGATTQGTGFTAFIIVIVGYYVASNGACSIIITSNTIYGIKNRGYIKRHIKGLIMIFILLLALLIMLFIPMFGDKVILFLMETSNSKIFVDRLGFIFNILEGPMLWLLLFCFIKLIYTMAPDRKICTKYVNYGAIFTTISWVFVSSIYSIYINEYANYNALYGNLANLIILMLWFYFLSYCFTIGLALNYHKEEENFYESLLKEENQKKN